MERLYFDAVAFIYYIEQRAPWYARIDARLAAGPVQIVVSDLTRMESRVKPIQMGNVALLAEFDVAFAVAELAPLTAAVFDRATDIRATLKFKTPDSIHLAAAVEAGCYVFYTNDHRLDAYTGIAVEVI